ncbi:arrestin domain-containing protein 3-like [Pholidichthys leucotaenia]
MTIKNFLIEYDAINSKNTFTCGDIINGRIILEVSKDTKIQSLIFRAQGEARVCWSEYDHYGHYGHSQTQLYWANEKYYDVQHPILREERQGTEVVKKGRHVFPFSFNIPDRLPSTFKSSTGNIVHKVKAELKQSMKFTEKAKAHFTLVSAADIPGLQDPQYASKDKSLNVFGSGKILMDVCTKQMGFKQGHALPVTVEITNNSSRSVKPKLILYEKQSFFAQGRRKVYTNDILRDKMEAIESSSGKQILTKEIHIPSQLPPSIMNSNIIKLEYRLKVQFDIKGTIDPTIKLPIVILPKVSAKKQPPPSAAIGFQQAYPNQPTWNDKPHQGAPQSSQQVYPHLPTWETKPDKGAPQSFPQAYPNQPTWDTKPQQGSPFQQDYPNQPTWPTPQFTDPPPSYGACVYPPSSSSSDYKT